MYILAFYTKFVTPVTRVHLLGSFFRWKEEKLSRIRPHKPHPCGPLSVPRLSTPWWGACAFYVCARARVEQFFFHLIYNPLPHKWMLNCVLNFHVQRNNYTKNFPICFGFTETYSAHATTRTWTRDATAIRRLPKPLGSQESTCSRQLKLGWDYNSTSKTLYNNE